MADAYADLLMPEWIVAAQEQVAGRLKAAEEAFRRDAAGVDLEWRAMLTFPSAVLVRASRVADRTDKPLNCSFRPAPPA